MAAGGGRISLSAPPAKVPVDPLLPSIEVDRYMEISTEYSDPAFQELGLQSSPTLFTGVVSNDIEFTLNINGTEVIVTLDKDVTDGTSDGPDPGSELDPANTSIADLVADLQAAVDRQLSPASVFNS